MNLSLHIAKRYLFSKKSHNAINIISGISAGGVCVGTIALVCVLSVFNGFGELIGNLFGTFDPDLKINTVEGKTFSASNSQLQQVKKLKSVVCFSEVLQENAMFRYNDKQETGTIKGVDDNFERLADIHKIIINGKYLLHDPAFNYGIAGVGLASDMGLGPFFTDPLYIYAPNRKEEVNMVNPENSFNLDHVFISSIFSMQQSEYDAKYLIIPISLARSLYQYNKDDVTSIELRIKKGTDINTAKEQIKEILGSKYKVLDRYEQQADYFKIMEVEKWITYLILSFILFIAVFNIIGSLSMLIIDKTNDIKTLRHMGASQGLIRKIFLYEGWLISILGSLIGLLLGSILCICQQQFGIITMPGEGDYIVKAYPVALEWSDLIIVFFTVCVMGFFAAYFPAKQIKMENFKDNN